MPSSGISQNDVRNVPAIEPAVEMAKSRPAVRPSFSIERAFKRTATGDTLPRTTLGRPKRRMVAITGFSRGPGSHSTTRSRTQPSTNGIASTSSAPPPSRPTRRRGVGYRSAMMPPSQYPVESPARTIPISEPQTYSELPKNGARTRLEAISRLSRTPPAMNTATAIASELRARGSSRGARGRGRRRHLRARARPAAPW